MISTHSTNKHIKFGNEIWTWVGWKGAWNNWESTERTCLKTVGPIWTAFDGELNFGLCRMPKDHDGPCADEVFTCDCCDNTYPVDGDVEELGNADVTMCGRCA